MSTKISSTVAQESRPRTPRGVLAMLPGDLPFYPYNPDHVRESTMVLRKHRQHGRQLGGQVSPTLQAYNHEQSSDYTLFFLADAHNLNSIRTRPLVVDFIEKSHSDCQCVCVPNSDDSQNELCSGTGFSCLPFEHENRSGIIRLLAASEVPCVIVIENATGRRITDKALQAIESNDAHELVKRWRRGESGLSLFNSLQSTCSIC